jgi:hypothetical protein
MSTNLVRLVRKLADYNRKIDVVRLRVMQEEKGVDSGSTVKELD